MLRLLLPLSVKIHQTFRSNIQELKIAAVRIIHRDTQSVGATGGVYKGQGRNQRKLMTCAYWEFLVYGEKLQAPIPVTKGFQRVTRSCRRGKDTLIPSV